ncbi:MAG: murein biosynthesis integral membrane protein MurJ [Anaerolineae bacterium]|nr:murein biosynthesis integral membrane protein MurJ [Anaerolineae bacterium]NUQ06620.1 murein biosynthesis integral membrane protein MurJ [Anaerolineae bacterium]
MASRALSNRQIARAALVIVLGFVASGVLGLLRTWAFSVTFGASTALDSFYAARQLPEALFVLVAGGALGSSFIPVFERFLAKGEGDAAWRLASAVMTCVFLLGAGLALLLAIFAPLIVPPLLEPGEPPATQALTTALTQIMLITVAIFGVSGLLMGILNAQRVFLLPALALSMNNIGQILGAFVLTRLFSTDGTPSIYGLAWGAVLGALLHLLVQTPGLRRAGAKLRILPSPAVPGVREVLLLMGPRMLGLGVVQINFIVNVNLTAGMVEGSRVALVTAWTLMFFLLGVIGQSVGSALFPSLSALAAAGDHAGYRSRLNRALLGVVGVSVPAMIAVWTLGAWGIDLVFGYGEWTPAATLATAAALSWFALGIPGHAALEILSRAFYALSDTRTPVMVSVASMTANILLSMVLIRLVGDPTSLTNGAFVGLAMANSLTTLVEAAALWLLLRHRLRAIPENAADLGL